MIEIQECEWHKGEELLRKGEYEKAREIFMKHVNFNLHDPYAWERLSQCYFMLALEYCKLYEKNNNMKYLEFAINFFEAAMKSLKYAMEDFLRETELTRK